MTRVKDHMVIDPIAATVPGAQRDLVRLFLRHGFAGFPVVKEGSKKLVGVVTRRHLFEAPDEVQVALLMDPNPTTTYPEAPVPEATRLVVENNLRLLPVVNGANDLVGLVMPRDLLRVLEGRRGRVSTLLTHRFVPIHRSTPAAVALEILRTTRVTAMPVLDDGARPVGILTDGDLLRHARIADTVLRTTGGLASEGDAWTWESARGERTHRHAGSRLELPDTVAEAIMGHPATTIASTTPIGEAAAIMARRGIHQLPVVDGGRLIDLLTDVDLLAALVT